MFITIVEQYEPTRASMDLFTLITASGVHLFRYDMMSPHPLCSVHS